MPALFEEFSTITAKGQTTVPKAVRRALGIDFGGRIAFRIDENGVTVDRADEEETDPAIDACRAKFGGQRFRLFFRYSGTVKVIIYAWVNDGEALRTCGARTDAHAVFRGMLDRGSLPEDWGRLLTEASAEAARNRLGALE